MTMSSVDEYPRVVSAPISRHADLRPSSNPFRKAFRFSSSPIPVPVYTAGQGIEVSRPSADVPEVLALVRRLGRGLDVLELRRDLVDLLRLVLQFVEGDLDAQVLREDVENGLRGLRVDKVSGRLAHQAHRLHVVQPSEAQEETARADDPRARLASREDDAVLLHLLYEVAARGRPQDARLRHHAAHAIAAQREHAAHAEFLQLLQDEVAELVLSLRRQALVVARQQDEVLAAVPLDVVHLVVHELNLAVLLHEDLGREVLREDLRELDRLQLVFQMLRGELADVPDPRQTLDEDRVVQLRVVGVADHDVLHGVSSLQFMGPLKFAPVHTVAVLRGVSRRHRIPGGMAASGANVLQRVPTAGPALLHHGPHRDSILPVELCLAAFRGQGLDHAGRGLLDLLFRGLVIRRPHDEPVARRADVLHLHAHAVVLDGGLRERLADVDRAVRTEIGRLDVAVDRDVRRDDVLPRDLDERRDPGTLEALVLEGLLVHDALLERPVERAERIEQIVPELLPALRGRLAEPRRDDREEVLRLLLVLPLLDLLAALVFVDRLQGEVDVPLVLVDLEDLADDPRAFAHVVADVLDPAGADLRDVDEALLALVLVEGDERPEVLDVRHGAYDELAFVGPVVAAPRGLRRLRLRHYSRTPRISPRIAAFPPVGFATVAPHTWHRTTLAARSKTTCSLPQSSHLTRRNRLVGFGITCAPPRARPPARCACCRRGSNRGYVGASSWRAIGRRYRGEVVFESCWVRLGETRSRRPQPRSPPSRPQCGRIPRARGEVRRLNRNKYILLY